MSYSAKFYARADAELERRRNRAEHDQRRRHDEVVAKIPPLLDVEREISSAGLDVVKAIGMGADAQDYIDRLAEKNLAAQKTRAQLLKAAGFSEDHLLVKYTCPKCRDTGFVEGIRCGCYKELLRSLAYAELCEDLPIGNSAFENFNLNYYPKAVNPETGVSPYKHMSGIYEFCTKYAYDFDAESPNLLLCGETGLGKTHLSLAIASAAVNKGFGVIYGSAQNILHKIEREHFDKRYADGDTIQAVLECDLLILDDLGAEFSTQFTVSVIYNMINTRLQKGLPTIISTNLSAKELEQRYTQRIASRVIGNYVTLAFCGSDVRQIKRGR
ncbi:MAG: ATP-binding protein [Oscillospiraceae bacterium]|nr:ATP-binding protein [Oscillospiraceae bacterium]